MCLTVSPCRPHDPEFILCVLVGSMSAHARTNRAASSVIVEAARYTAGGFSPATEIKTRFGNHVLFPSLRLNF